MAQFRIGKRGGLVVDRDSLHASPEYRRQIDSLTKLQGNPMNADVEKAVEDLDSLHGLPEVAEMIRQALRDQEAEIARLENALAMHVDRVVELIDAKASQRIALVNRIEKDVAMLRKCRQFVAWATERLPEAVPVYDELNSHLGGEQ